MNAWRWGAVLVAVLAIGAGVWYYLTYHKVPPPVAAVLGTPSPAPAPEAPAPSPPPAPDYPVPPAPPAAAPLPALDESDAAFRHAVEQLVGGSSFASFFVSDMLIRRLVATIDNLGRDRVAVNLLPVKPTPGSFLVTAAGDNTWIISAANEARYRPFVDSLISVDPKTAVALYFRWYPRFEKAYADLGFPNQSFNNRLIAVIDNLLNTPEPTAPPLLVRPKVFYQYADAQTESLSAGERLLLRMGSDNRARIKAQLRALRGEIVAAGDH